MVIECSNDGNKKVVDDVVMLVIKDEKGKFCL